MKGGFKSKRIFCMGISKHIVEQAMTAAVSKTIKNRSAAYKAKVEYNKRNNLDWKGNPKK